MDPNVDPHVIVTVYLSHINYNTLRRFDERSQKQDKT